MRIVVVDDEPPITQLCVKVLEQQGHEVEGFTRGDEALARLASVAADLLVVDYKMPRLTGFEVIQRARALRPALKVVMITGHGTREIVDGAMALGANDVLLKPFTPKELCQAVATAFGTSSPSPRAGG
jgi:DNA-binding response OmpR family regulator